MAELQEFDQGLVVGLLIGEGSFGGDGKQPQVTLRMHIRHEAIFRWLVDRFPDSRLYGPYHHGGRSYYQWMARGRTLVRDVLPLLEQHVDDRLDGHAAERLGMMRHRYAGYIAREREVLRGKTDNAAVASGADAEAGSVDAPDAGSVRPPDAGFPSA
jgi:hypothetical protein